MSTTTVESTPASPKRSLPFRILRVVAYVVLALVVIVTNVVVGAFFYAKTNRAREQALRFGMKKLQPIIPGGATLGSSEGDLTQGLVLHDFVLNDLDGRPAVKVDRLELKYSLLPLLLTRVQVDLVGVQGVTVISQPLADGRDNLATMAKIDKPLPKPPKALPVSVVLEELNVQARFVKLPAGGSIDKAPKDTDVNAVVYARANLSHGMVATIDDLTIDVASPARAKISMQGGVHIVEDPKKMDLRHINLRVEGDTTALRRRVDKLELKGPVLVVATANGTIDDLVATLGVDTQSPKVRVRADAHVRADRVDLHELTVKSPFASVDAHGAYHFDNTGEGEVHVNAPDLRPMSLFGAPPMSGSVKLDATAMRTDGHFSAKVDGLVKSLHIAKNQIGHISLDVAMQDLDGHAVINADDLVLGAVQLKTMKVNADGGPKGVKVAVDAHGPEGLDIELGAGATPKLEGKKLEGLVATLDRFKLRAGGTPWGLDHQTRIDADFKAKKYVLAPLGLSNDVQHLTVEGKLLGDQLADVHLDLKHFDLSQLPAIVSPGHVLPHTDVQATAEATGPVSQPNVGWKFEGKGDGRTDHDLIRLTATGEGRLAKARINAKVFATIGGQKVSAKVDAPMPLRPGQPIDVSFDASVLLNAWFADLLVPKVIQSQPILLYTLGAKVTAQGSITGTTSDPKINASARVARWGTVNSHGDLGASFQYEKKHLGAGGTLTLSELPLGGGSAAGVVQATASMPIDLGPMFSGEEGNVLDKKAEWAATLNFKHVDIEKLPFEGLGIVPIVGHGWVDATAQLSGTDEHPRASVHFDARGLDFAGVADVGLLGDAKLDGISTTASIKVSIKDSPALDIQGSIGADSSAKVADRNAWRNAPLAATIKMPGFDLARIQVFKQIDGNVNGSGVVTGTWAHPKVVATMNIPSLKSGTTEFKSFEIKSTIVDGKMIADVAAVQTTGATLNAHGEAPFAGGVMAGNIDASHFKVDLASELIPTLRSIRGELDGKVVFAGTTAKPKLSGSMSITKGELAVAKTAITYRDLTTTLAFEGDGFSFKGMKMSAGSGGTLEGDGHVALRALHPDVVAAKVTLKKYPIEWDVMTATADANLTVSGKYDIRDGGFDTLVNIDSGRVELKDDHSIGGLIPTAHLDDVKVGKARPDAIDNPAAKPRVAAKNGKHYDVTFKGPFTVHGRELDAQAHADVKVDISTEIPTASGVLTLDPRGVVRLFGQTYDLEHGRVLFGNIAQPNLDLRLARGVERARVGVDIGGSSRQPTTTFWSVPVAAYPPGEIASMVTGQKAEKDGTVVKKGLDQKVGGPISNLIAVSFRQAAPASKTVDVEKRQPIADPSKNKQ